MTDKADGPHTMRFTDGTPGGVTFYPFAAAVAWDYLLERGYAPEFLGHGESHQDFRQRIRGLLARCWPVTALGTRVSAATQWFQWGFVHRKEDLPAADRDNGYRLWGAAPAWRIFAWVRQGGHVSTEDVFRELEAEEKGIRPRALSLPWAHGYVQNSTAPNPWSHVRYADGYGVSPRLPEHWLSDPRVVAWRREAERLQEKSPPGPTST